MGRPSGTSIIEERYVPYLQAEKGRRPKTLYGHELAAKRLIAQLGESGKHLLDVELADLRRFMLQPTQKGKNGAGVEPSPATKHRKAAEMRTLCHWLFREGLIPRDPSVDLESPPVHDENPKPFPNDAWRVLWASDLALSDRVAFGLARFCGLRTFEVTGLTAANFMDVPRPLIVNFGRKGGKYANFPWYNATRWWAKKMPELLGGDAATFTDAVRELRSRRPDCPALLPWQDEIDAEGRRVGRMYYERPKGHIDPQTLARQFERALKAAGLPASTGTPHMLRHAFCTDLLLGGKSLVEVSRLAGHAKLDTTRRYVLTPDDPFEADLVDEPEPERGKAKFNRFN